MSIAGVLFRRPWRVMCLGAMLVIYAALTSCGSSAGASPVATATAVEKLGPITVKIENPNIEMAIARVSGSILLDDLDGDILTFASCFDNEFISVWSPGFYIAKIECNGNAKEEYSVKLTPLSTDNPNYAWISAEPHSVGSLNCATCHVDVSLGLNEYNEWKIDGHSSVFADPYFWNVYMGTNLHQNPAIEDGLGYRINYPNQNGNCAFCHAPASLQLLQQGSDWTARSGAFPIGLINVETEGITCDICHKVTDVILGSDDRPNVQQPGILSLTLSRPSSGDIAYLGPWADSMPGIFDTLPGVKHLTTCSPIFSESKFCAACHYGKFYDTVIYNSYGEWLSSDYSKKEINGEENLMYRSCQDCHMTPSQPINPSVSWKARAACSSENQIFRDSSHNMMKRDNTGDPALIEGAAEVTVQATKEKGMIKVVVTVTNIRAGHKLPTDSPLRHLILVVEARDREDKLLAQADGPRIPEWGGSGDKTQDFAGKPGVIYANLLKDKVSNSVPSVAYWNTITPAWEGSDTRLVPFQKITSEYWFVAPTRGSVEINARLWYRYAFIDLMRQKGWDRADKLVNWGYDKVE